MKDGVTDRSDFPRVCEKCGLARLLVMIFLSSLAIVRTDGFSPQIISQTIKNKKSHSIDPSELAILSQPFSYLGKGRQCYVFESLDGKYVIKFFNAKYFTMPWYAFLHREKEQAKRTLRRSFFENSYEIALQEMGEEILFLHLGTSTTYPPLSIRDKASRVFQIDLNSNAFVIQQKGRPIYPALEKIYQKEGLKGLCREIDHFFDQIEVRIAKQIADADSDIEHNWGYIEGHLFHLDPGRLYYDPTLSTPKRRHQEWQSSTRRFGKWLKSHYPDASLYFKKKFANLII
jgi:hypothetical protein